MLTKPFLLAFIAMLAVLAGIGATQDPVAAAKPSPSPSKAEYWQLTGNSGINAAAQFLGTKDGQPLIFKTGGTERMRVGADGGVRIGTANPNPALHVAGGDVLMDGGGYNFANPKTSVADLAFFRGGTPDDGVFTMRRYANEHTVLRIASPPETFFDSNEATLALVRGDENQEIVDFYNNGYLSETQYGIRMIKDGDGAFFRDFVFDYYDGSKKEEVLRLTPERNVGVRTQDPQSSLQIGGYVQLDLTTDLGAPPPEDCDGSNHYGRMMVDAVGQSLYICVAPTGGVAGGIWIAK